MGSGSRTGHSQGDTSSDTPKAFRFQAKYGLLTYAQCGDLDPWLVNAHLGRLGAECIIGRESHKSGGLHLHCFFMFEKKYSTRDCRAFDVGDCHPNIVAGYGTPSAGYDYAIKDGDVVAGGLERPSGNDTSLSGPSGVWARIVLAETRDEFFGLCQDLDPRSLCVNFTSLRAYADWRYRLDRAPYTHPTSLELETDHMPGLSRWAHANLGNCKGGKFPDVRQSRTKGRSAPEGSEWKERNYPLPGGRSQS